MRSTHAQFCLIKVIVQVDCVITTDKTKYWSGIEQKQLKFRRWEGGGATGVLTKKLFSIKQIIWLIRLYLKTDEKEVFNKKYRNPEKNHVNFSRECEYIWQLKHEVTSLIIIIVLSKIAWDQPTFACLCASLLFRGKIAHRDEADRPPSPPKRLATKTMTMTVMMMLMLYIWRVTAMLRNAGRISTPPTAQYDAIVWTK